MWFRSQSTKFSWMQKKRKTKTKKHILNIWLWFSTSCLKLNAHKSIHQWSLAGQWQQRAIGKLLHKWEQHEGQIYFGYSTARCNVQVEYSKHQLSSVTREELVCSFTSFCARIINFYTQLKAKIPQEQVNHFLFCRCRHRCSGLLKNFLVPNDGEG